MIIIIIMIIMIIKVTSRDLGPLPGPTRGRPARETREPAARRPAIRASPPLGEPPRGPRGGTPPRKKGAGGEHLSHATTCLTQVFFRICEYVCKLW